MCFTIEDLVDLEQPSEVQISPDGSYVAFVVGKSGKADKDTPFEKTIHIMEVATRSTCTISAGITSDLPRWSPDSRRIAFISNQANPDEMQLCLLDGDTVEVLTDLRGSVDSPVWSTDGTALAFRYGGTLDLEKRADPDPVVVDLNPPFKRVWILDYESRHLRAVTPEDCHIFEYDWSPDGEKLVLLTSPHPNPGEGWYSAQLHTVDLATGAVRQICTMPHQIGRLSWSPDSTTIAFVSGVMSDEGNVSGEVYIVSGVGGEARCITPELDYSITWIEWLDEGILYGGRQIESAVAGWIDPQSGEQRLLSKRSFEKLGSRQTAQHETDHGGINHAGAGNEMVFIILAQAPSIEQPSKGALDDPALGQDLKTSGFR